MAAEDLVRRCRQLASQQAAFQGPVQLASPLEDGEDLDSVHVDDADHWVGVYSELSQFKRDLLREIDRQARELGPEAAPHLSRNRRAFVLELQRIDLHLEYWRRRREELREHSTQRS